MHQRNFPLTDPKTGKVCWVSPSVAILAKVIVTDEVNGPEHRTSREKAPTEHEELAYASHFFDGKKGESYYLYTFRNKDYVKKTYALVNKRGAGCPKENYKWNITVGYKDFGETAIEACSREVLEEDKVYIAPEKFVFQQYADSEDLENVTLRFTARLTMDEYLKAVEVAKAMNSGGGENNEVEAIDLMEITTENINAREWAFNHKELLEQELLPVIYVV